MKTYTVKIEMGVGSGAAEIAMELRRLAERIDREGIAPGVVGTISRAFCNLNNIESSEVSNA